MENVNVFRLYQRMSDTLNPPTDPPPALLLRHIRKDLWDWTMDEAAKRCGYKTTSGYQDYENPEKKPGWLPIDFVRRLVNAAREARITEPSEEELFLRLAGAVSRAALTELKQQSSLQSDIDTSRIVSRENLLAGPDFPVYASAECGEGMTVIPEVIMYVNRPQPVIGIEKSFGVYIIGDSMSPEYEQGDMALVDAASPIIKGKNALFAKASIYDGETTAIIKRVLGWNDRIYRVMQHNGAVEFELDRTVWRIAYPIVGKYDRR